MNETLWRAGTLLGELVIPTPATRGGIAGMFVPTPDCADIAPLWQFRMHDLPGAPVFERLLSDRSVEAPVRSARRLSYTTGAAYPLKPLNEEQAKGIPASLQLELRDKQGRRLDVDTIIVDRFPIPPAGTRNEIRDACEAVGIEPSGWVIAAFPPRSVDGADGD